MWLYNGEVKSEECRVLRIKKTSLFGFSKYNKNISGGVYKLDLVKETDGQTSQRNSP